MNEAIASDSNEPEVACPYARRGQTAGKLFFAVTAAVVLALELLCLVGCGSSVDVAEEFERRQRVSQQAMVDELFDNAVGLINDVGQIGSRDMLVQVVNRLNQWIESRKPIDDWRVDPLVSTLPAAIQSHSIIRSLPEHKFLPGDGWALQEAIWLRDASQYARGRADKPLDIATALIDWTVRNLQLEPVPPAGRPPRQAWEIMVLGRATAIERAWVFMLLARQQGLNVVLITPQGGDMPGDRSSAWLVGLVDGEQIYLFDAARGRSMPRADGQGDVTLAAAASDDAILKALASDGAPSNPIQAADLAKVTVWLEASPAYLTQRFRQIERRLSGEQRTTLSADLSALAERLKKLPQVAEVRLWTEPFERIRQRQEMSKTQVQSVLADLRPFLEPVPTLFKARVLQLRGKLTGEDGAIRAYQSSRPSNQDLAKVDIPADLRQRIDIAKQNATYWLGVIALERGNYDAAIEYLDARTLKAHPDGPWTDGAKLLLARAQQARGK